MSSSKRKNPIPPEEVEEMLAELSAHFGEPVRPVSHYCKALDAWGKVADIKDYRSIRAEIMKSNLLARMIYGGEKLRTKQCPRHHGVWFGVPGMIECEYDCGGTGWLMEPEDVERYKKMKEPVDDDE